MNHPIIARVLAWVPTLNASLVRASVFHLSARHLVYDRQSYLQACTVAW
jgi:hypothetical protein